MGDKELEKLLARVHDGVSTFGYGKSEVPCIMLDDERFGEIMSRIAGRPVSVFTELDILQDGEGHVFVEVELKFSEGDINEKVLINAATSLGFFELLAETAMLALTPSRPEAGGGNVFMIQLPQPLKAQEALEIIKKGLGPRREAGGPGHDAAGGPWGV
ncbi:hypothetical protein CENSYa_1130 [Cenarchaeum symbiosum A]|uniref:Uncharacterized protein n=1 Tax=Cenarchaeum symbiosum (strain A) TaxID=414004 RepID=A0RWP2_CENSY|nr:hypothetical protein CENSYa_1130 [Cenarchaeum symbiosum A]